MSVCIGTTAANCASSAVMSVRWRTHVLMLCLPAQIARSCRGLRPLPRRPERPHTVIEGDLLMQDSTRGTAPTGGGGALKLSASVSRS